MTSRTAKSKPQEQLLRITLRTTGSNGVQVVGIEQEPLFNTIKKFTEYRSKRQNDNLEADGDVDEQQHEHGNPRKRRITKEVDESYDEDFDEEVDDYDPEDDEEAEDEDEDDDDEK